VTPALRPKAEQDLFLREKLSAPAAQSAILAWAVRGCRDWLEHGLGTCAAVEASTAAYHEEQDRSGGFLRDCCRFGTVERVATKELTRAYLRWCEDENTKPLSGKDLGARLRKRGCSDTKSNGARYWCGVRLLRDDEEPDTAAGTAGTAEGHQFPRPSPKRSHEATSRDLLSSADPGDPGEDEDTFADYVEREVGPCS